MELDPRLQSRMLIRRNPETGRRQIIIGVDGNEGEWPVLTSGDIECEPVIEWGEAPGQAFPRIVGYKVHMTCWVPHLMVKDPEVLKEQPSVDIPDSLEDFG